MIFADATAYVLTLVALTLAPGPLVLLMVAHADGNDMRGAIGFGVWLQSAPEIREFGRIAMLIHIGWLIAVDQITTFTFLMISGLTVMALGFCFAVIIAFAEPLRRFARQDGR